MSSSSDKPGGDGTPGRERKNSLYGDQQKKVNGVIVACVHCDCLLTDILHVVKAYGTNILLLTFHQLLYVSPAYHRFCCCIRVVQWVWLPLKMVLYLLKQDI